MVYLETDSNGRVELRHNRPQEIDTSAGVVVDSVPNRPGPDQELYVVNGSPTWKKARYRYRNDLPALKEHLKEKVLERQKEEETKAVTYNGSEFPCDRDSQGRIGSAIKQGEIAEANGQSFTFPAMTTSGNQIDLDLAGLKGLAQVYADQVTSARARAQELTNTIEGATSADTLLSLDISAGW
ncbi:hypothetical protein GGQ13_003021 [Salinibacter ruber]|uniref:DUF4376 domain-containing protein n=1 Tax=Salinibacter ruber TaxID=146919 RepID=UPI002167B48B|nr:DUF4376 domain-containing protein [Salinibacter ruber]MCS4139566.1 hypothetical protein [Salinibacter ruber]